jgi:hypothetical protein
MFNTPYTLSVNLWHATLPIYEWAPDPAVLPIASVADAGVVDGGSIGATLPRMRLVYKGAQVILYPVWTSRENLAWEQAAQRCRDEDEARNGERLRAPRSPAARGGADADAAATRAPEVQRAPSTGTGSDPGWEGPQ